ncbi:hypothetical protein [Enterococcus faecalis]|uniref:Uncharacterized protein n=1 Tax=Enterococcus faecalis RP2S-4 TaxID=1244145 RepID=A0ABC9TIJ4_ENTFL|nr:hypothetical protein [Enterococcus faecalis]EPI07139.1 hypothetical protein D358_02018 [Enterococcus faecalis RP2S-4]
MMKKLSMIFATSVTLISMTFAGLGAVTADASAVKDVNGDDVVRGKTYFMKTNIINPDEGLPTTYYAIDEIRSIGRDFVSGTSEFRRAGKYYFAGSGSVEEGNDYDLSSSRDGRSWNYLPAAGVYPKGGIYLSSDVGDTSFKKSSSGGYELSVDGHSFIYNTASNSFNNVGSGKYFTMDFVPVN